MDNDFRSRTFLLKFVNKHDNSDKGNITFKGGDVEQLMSDDNLSKPVEGSTTNCKLMGPVSINID